MSLLRHYLQLAPGWGLSPRRAGKAVFGLDDMHQALISRFLELDGVEMVCRLSIPSQLALMPGRAKCRHFCDRGCCSGFHGVACSQVVYSAKVALRLFPTRCSKTATRG